VATHETSVVYRRAARPCRTRGRATCCAGRPRTLDADARATVVWEILSLEVGHNLHCSCTVEERQSSCEDSWKET
jgi:hypothetical protein